MILKLCSVQRGEVNRILTKNNYNEYQTDTCLYNINSSQKIIISLIYLGLTLISPDDVKIKRLLGKSVRVKYLM